MSSIIFAFRTLILAIFRKMSTRKPQCSPLQMATSLRSRTALRIPRLDPGNILFTSREFLLERKKKHLSPCGSKTEWIKRILYWLTSTICFYCLATSHTLPSVAKAGKKDRVTPFMSKTLSPDAMATHGGRSSTFIPTKWPRMRPPRRPKSTQKCSHWSSLIKALGRMEDRRDF